MEDLKLFYKKHSTIILPGVFILGAFIIIMQVVLPAFSIVGETKQQLDTEQQKLNDYNASIESLRQLDETKLNDDVKVATSALPSTKDIEAIYLAITSSAARAGVTLTGFSVVLGGVYGKVDAPVEATTMPYVLVKIQIAGVDMASLVDFSNTLLDSSPLSKIVSANIASGGGDVDILFYYRPYDLNQINKDVVKPLNQTQTKLLQSLPQLP